MDAACTIPHTPVVVSKGVLLQLGVGSGQMPQHDGGIRPIEAVDGLVRVTHGKEVVQVPFQQL